MHVISVLCSKITESFFRTAFAHIGPNCTEIQDDKSHRFLNSILYSIGV